MKYTTIINARDIIIIVVYILDCKVGDALLTSGTLPTDKDGAALGIDNGVLLGILVGIADGMAEGNLGGVALGLILGSALGIDNGVLLGINIGITDGMAEGDVKGVVLELVLGCVVVVVSVSTASLGKAVWTDDISIIQERRKVLNIFLVTSCSFFVTMFLFVTVIQ